MYIYIYIRIHVQLIQPYTFMSITVLVFNFWTILTLVCILKRIHFWRWFYMCIYSYFRCMHAHLELLMYWFFLCLFVCLMLFASVAVICSGHVYTYNCTYTYIYIYYIYIYMCVIIRIYAHARTSTASLLLRLLFEPDQGLWRSVGRKLRLLEFSPASPPSPPELRSTGCIITRNAPLAMQQLWPPLGTGVQGGGVAKEPQGISGVLSCLPLLDPLKIAQNIGPHGSEQRWKREERS